MLIYIIPVLVFIVTSVLLYMVSNHKSKNETKQILIRNVLPGLVISLLVFVIIKYRDSQFFNPEPLQHGNFFDE
jgi:RsiW-degrading membrane proteinase PrsW (M82 family)